MKRLVLIFALLVMVFTGCSGKSAKMKTGRIWILPLFREKICRMKSKA